MIKKGSLFVALMFVMQSLYAQDQCEILRKKSFRLLAQTTFNVDYAHPLTGCFSGYLPHSPQDGAYRFGIFKDGELSTSLPEIEAAQDLASNALQELSILAVSFNDIDGNGMRDITVIGRRMIANGERIFVQVYWGCGANFLYDNKVNSDINWDVSNRPAVSIKAVQSYVRKKKLKAQCGNEKR